MSAALFKQIEDILPSLHGWCELPKACTLASMVLALRPDVTVEIGVWGGRSLLPMALAHKHLGNGIVYAVDPWMAAISKEGQMGDNLKWWGEQNHEMVYRHFMDKVHELAVQNVVRVHRMKSDDFQPPGVVDIVHIDGNHGPQAIKDVSRFAPIIRRGGFCILDDLNWDGGNVGKAAQLLVQFGFKKLYDLGTGAVYQCI